MSDIFYRKFSTEISFKKYVGVGVVGMAVLKRWAAPSFLRSNDLWHYELVTINHCQKILIAPQCSGLWARPETEKWNVSANSRAEGSKSPESLQVPAVDENRWAFLFLRSISSMSFLCILAIMSRTIPKDIWSSKRLSPCQQFLAV